jgi:hypothetical protein
MYNIYSDPPGNISFEIHGKQLLNITPDGFFINGEKIEDKNNIYDAMSIFCGYIGKPWHAEIAKLAQEFPDVDPSKIVDELRRLLNLKAFI